jgi:hypothetical protein
MSGYLATLEWVHIMEQWASEVNPTIVSHAKTWNVRQRITILLIYSIGK